MDFREQNQADFVDSLSTILEDDLTTYQKRLLLYGLKLSLDPQKYVEELQYAEELLEDLQARFPASPPRKNVVGLE